MCAPVFVEFFQYSWYKGGYVEDHPGPFKTPVQRCLSPDNASHSCKSCPRSGFILCPYCREVYCFDCFVVDFHRCC
ncbi:unnamed protein product, partial [Mesorhabditis spiculigera]